MLGESCAQKEIVDLIASYASADVDLAWTTRKDNWHYAFTPRVPLKPPLLLRRKAKQRAFLF